MKRPFYFLAFICLLSALSAWHLRSEATLISLGEALFKDPLLSSDSTISCASCHKPDFSFSDTSAFSLGVDGKTGTRNTPAVVNQNTRTSFFWDGRAKTLAEQAVFPIENPVEMNLPIEEAIQRLKENAKYKKQFNQLFGKDPDKESLGLALAAFQETLVTGETPFDRWMNDEETAMSAAAIRGRDLFMEKGRCFDCHSGPDFTNDEFRNIGLFDQKTFTDSGRGAISRQPEDLGKFKVPPLRNVAVTGPYMHNGMFRTLAEVVSYYNHPTRTVANPVNADSLVQTPLNLTPQEESDLVEFLKALTEDKYSHLIPKN